MEPCRSGGDAVEKKGGEEKYGHDNAVEGVHDGVAEASTSLANERGMGVEEKTF